jgi:hypothetical protein
MNKEIRLLDETEPVNKGSVRWVGKKEKAM